MPPVCGSSWTGCWPHRGRKTPASGWPGRGGAPKQGRNGGATLLLSTSCYFVDVSSLSINDRFSLSFFTLLSETLLGSDLHSTHSQLKDTLTGWTRRQLQPTERLLVQTLQTFTFHTLPRVSLIKCQQHKIPGNMNSCRSSTNIQAQLPRLLLRRTRAL